MHFQTSEQEKLELGFGGYTCNWGLHIAGLYETQAERDEIIMGFLHKGDINGDFQIFIPSEQTPENFTKDYCKLFPDCCTHLNDPSRFVMIEPASFYYPDGKFDPHRMIEGHNKYYADSQKNGKRNIRATAEMVWALEKFEGVEYLMAYEATLNHFFPGKPWISICLYNVTKFSGSLIVNVLRTHPYTISGGVITQNPYFIDPDKYLAQYYPEFAY